MSDLNNIDHLNIKYYNPFNDFEPVEIIWCSLLEKTNHSYFLSWGWMANWIKSLPSASDLRLVVGYIEKDPVFAFFVGTKKMRKYGFLPTRIMSLNSSADPYFDKLFIEHNSILVDQSITLREKVFHAILSLQDWDEFILPGISPEFLENGRLFSNKHSQRLNFLIDESMQSFFVELDKIRAAGMSYLQILSANKRSQIRRSIKQYEKDGKIQIVEAASVDECRTMFDALVSLHQQEWAKREISGAFSNNYLYQFHLDLISSRFANREIQLLHIFNNKMTIGYLYNFTYRGNVLFYQSGFNYMNENIYRPGIVSHYFAILYNASKNYLIYDFLAGDSAYKSSLSTNSIPIYWARLIKKRWRWLLVKKVFEVKNLLERLKIKS